MELHALQTLVGTTGFAAMLAGACRAIGAAWSGMLGNFAAGAGAQPAGHQPVVGTVIAVLPYCHTDHCWQVHFVTSEMLVRVDRDAGWPTQTQMMKTVTLAAPSPATAAPRSCPSAGAS